MADKKIKCPFCEGVAFVKTNVRGDPFISCPKCGAINARGAAYRAYIAKHQYEQSEVPAPELASEKEPEQKEPKKQKEGWINDW